MNDDVFKFAPEQLSGQNNAGDEFEMSREINRLEKKDVRTK